MAIVGTLLVIVFGALAIIGHELGGARGRRLLIYVGKPAATLSLLLIVGLPPADRFAGLIAGGVLFNLAGDILLISEADLPFLVAVPLVLTGHILYTVAFAGAAAGGAFWPPPWPAGFVALLSIALVSLLWPGLGVMKAPVVVYAVAITAMVAAACKTVNGPLPAVAAGAATVGAFLFYVSDATLAWNRFRRRFPHAAALTLATYWLGQIGIAWSARLHTG
ncbi:MAG TPA: lysoplasmalogenase [Polyangia bacterium]|nr:lysoplasmalogenase [Polyangia bacterium]